MSYVEGFVLAVSSDKKQEFIETATGVDAIFLEYGALRVMECWGDDVPRGELTDFYKAVKAKDDETVVFSWIIWPDKDTKTSAMEEMMKDPRFAAGENPMPFDGRRMIFGGFQPVIDLG